MNQSQNDNQTEVLTEVRTKKPKKYQIILHNDDYTPMDFVVYVLTDIFNKNMAEAEKITLTIHHEGKAIVGEYVKEIAQSKKNRVEREAKEAKHPLKCTMEEQPSPSHSSGPKF